MKYLVHSCPEDEIYSSENFSRVAAGLDGALEVNNPWQRTYRLDGCIASWIRTRGGVEIRATGYNANAVGDAIKSGLESRPTG